MDILPGKQETKNKNRIKFNRKLYRAMKNNYIGGYNYMMRKGFTTVSDGEHYTKATSLMIYKYIVRKAGWTLG